MNSALSVGFLRPRMGIGGAERLVADAAVLLRQRGHQVTLFVPESDNVAQFPELAANQIRFDTHGASLPSHLAGRLRAPMAIARTAYAGWRMSRGAHRPQVVFSDVVPHVIPLVKRLSRVPVLYFCNFPDLLLTRQGSREHAAYRAYRQPLDRIEERGVASADLVVTNSRFTSAIVRDTFPSLRADQLTVLYPGVPVPEMLPAPVLRDSEIVLLSVSRFDPRKNLPLAIDALRELRSRVPADLFSRVQLVLAGHHNLRLPEDVALVSALRRQAADTGLSDHVQLVFSPSEEERRALVARCRAVLYTPTAEHFGYVPVEAMAAGRPVVAVNNGGPTETVLHNMTGMLCAPTPIAFGQALATLVQQPDVADSMGRAGYAHVKAHFSLEAFGDTLETLLSGLVQAHHRSRQ